MHDPDYGKKLATRLTELRIQHNWSLDDLACASGISRASLSRIERNEVSPTADVLNQLCIAYRMTMSSLISMVEEKAESLFRSEQQSVWQDEASGFHRRLLIPPASQFRCELIEGQLRPAAFIEYLSPPVQGLEQYIWLYAGELTVTMDSEAWTLNKGDSLRFHLSGKTTFSAHDTLGAHYLLVICKS